MSVANLDGRGVSHAGLVRGDSDVNPSHFTLVGQLRNLLVMKQFRVQNPFLGFLTKPLRVAGDSCLKVYDFKLFNGFFGRE